jgi:hypothetical protein
VELLGLRMTIVNNWYFGVVSLSSLKQDKVPALLATRYFFAQFWTEFSRDVLQEFYYEDLEVLRAEKVKLE